MLARNLCLSVCIPFVRFSFRFEALGLHFSECKPLSNLGSFPSHRFLNSRAVMGRSSSGSCPAAELH